jgi:nucleotide-binding universal stress UspA family protein
MPQRILLATDLSARCDRALERALELAAHWQAQLVILHVFKGSADAHRVQHEASLPSWRRPADATAIARQRIRQGLHAEVQDVVEQARVLVEEGNAAEVIERIAVAEHCDLVITGIAHEAPLARQTARLGSTVSWLLRHASVPLLIVRNRARASYQHILATTDLSAASGHALQTALRFFPDLTLDLLHAYQAPYSGSGLVSDPVDFERKFRELLQRDLDIFLDSIPVTKRQRLRIRLLIERGSAAPLVTRYVNDHDTDLVVLGTRGRGVVLESLLGSTAKEILAMLPCDALMVRGPR